MFWLTSWLCALSACQLENIGASDSGAVVEDDSGTPVEHDAGPVQREDAGPAAEACIESRDCADDYSVCRPFTAVERTCQRVVCTDDSDCATEAGEVCLPGARFCTWKACLTDQDCVGNPRGEVCHGQLFQCAPKCISHAETCNGLDDNCDGVVDESLVRSCVTICGEGTQTCVTGQWSECSARQPTLEICNSLDDNCDGVTDEDMNRPCATICAVGVERCLSGEYQTCDARVPQTEICDGADNDCDGIVDNVFAATFADNNEHCGRCGNDCTNQFDNAVGACTNGACVLESCDQFWHDQDGTGEACLYFCVQTASNEVSPNGCDNTDNDCDGSTDEGCACTPPGATQSCGATAEGACLLGIQVCSSGQWGMCLGNRDPVLETCDQVDNDCDGSTDEGNPGSGVSCDTGLPGQCAQGLTMCVAGQVVCNTAMDPGSPACSCSDGDEEFCGPRALGGTLLVAGECTFGVRQCNSDGTWGGCVGAVFPSADDALCNSLDDDCDGGTDEDVDFNSDVEHCGACDSACAVANGVPVCAAGKCEIGSCESYFYDLDNDPLTGCEYGPCINEGPETCDGRDNNCDGATDEGNPGSGAVCVTGLAGACSAGTTACENGTIGCNSNVDPVLGTCDCNDYDPPQSCGPVDGNGQFLTAGICHVGSRTCSAGALGPCAGFQGPVTETCNGADDDCDGSTDEGGLLQVCSTVCGTGAEQCVNGSFDPSTCNAVQPTTDVCDGVDNDCDSATDEADPNVGSVCTVGTTSGVCVPGRLVCSSGSLTCVSNIQPSAEICNSLDDDCDGGTDEGVTQGCTSPCGSGVSSCINGVFDIATCTAPPAQNEVCDNVDNDCDGSTDEGNPGSGGSCAVNGAVGICLNGSFSCVAGALTCGQTIQPSAEACNSLDDDCDGSTDEGGLLRACSSVCGTGAEQCVNGSFDPSTCNAVQPTTDVCDGVDNDCDSATDEADPLERTVCNAPGAQGVCVPGVYVCVNGALVCASTVQPSAEACNSLDDDCDGSTDDGLGSTTCGLGACQVTVVNCMTGTVQICTPGNASAEACNSLDDDCDGAADEGNPGGGGVCVVAGQMGVCANSTRLCTGGALTCPQTIQPSAEACNSLDDDCDGATDEGLLTSCTSACGSGVMQCVNGQYDQSSCTAPPVPVEACNGADDDCDGLFDEGDLCLSGFACSGSMCRPDADGDRVINTLDNCLNVANPDQADTDANGVGDACQPGTPLPSGFCTGANLLTGSSFEDPALSGWNLEFSPVDPLDPAETAASTQDSVLKVDGASSGRVVHSTAYPLGEAWRVQLKQTVTLTVGAQYELCGWFRGDSARDVVVQVVEDQAPFTASLAWRQFPVNAVSFELNCFSFTAASAASQRVTLMVGNSAVPVNVDRFTLQSCP